MFIQTDSMNDAEHTKVTYHLQCKQLKMFSYFHFAHPNHLSVMLKRKTMRRHFTHPFSSLPWMYLISSNANFTGKMRHQVDEKCQVEWNCRSEHVLSRISFHRNLFNVNTLLIPILWSRHSLREIFKGHPRQIFVGRSMKFYIVKLLAKKDPNKNLWKDVSF